MEKNIMRKRKKIRNSYRTKIISLWFIVFALLFVILGFIVDDKMQSESIYKSLLLVILSTSASIFGIGAAWELFCKRSFGMEILSINGISENIIQSGIDCFYENFNDIDWKKELGNIKRMEIFVTYAASWRNQNRERLEAIAKSGELIVVLPNYHNVEVVENLDFRFKYGKYDENRKNESVESFIEKAAKDFTDMGAQVKLFDGTICSSYYHIDSYYLYAPFKHGNSNKRSVPAIKCRKGTFYEFCENEMKTIIDNSKDWSRDEVEKN